MILQAGRFPQHNSNLSLVTAELFTESERTYLYYEVVDLKTKF